MGWRHLPEKARTLFLLEALLSVVTSWVPALLGAATFLSWIAISVFEQPFLTVLPWSVGGGVAMLILLFLRAVWLPGLAWARWSWQLRDTDLLLAHGVLTHVVNAVPRRRIQHVDIHQGVLARSFGLATLRVYTASGGGADGVLPGIELEEAERLRDVLVADEGDDGV